MKKSELKELIKEEIQKLNEDSEEHSAKNDLAQIMRDAARIYKSPKTLSLAKSLSSNCKTTDDVLKKTSRFFSAHEITDSDVIAAVIDRAIKIVQDKDI